MTLKPGKEFKIDEPVFELQPFTRSIMRQEITFEFREKNANTLGLVFWGSARMASLNNSIMTGVLILMSHDDRGDQPHLFPWAGSRYPRCIRRAVVAIPISCTVTTIHYEEVSYSVANPCMCVYVLEAACCEIFYSIYTRIPQVPTYPALRIK